MKQTLISGKCITKIPFFPSASHPTYCLKNYEEFCWGLTLNIKYRTRRSWVYIYTVSQTHISETNPIHYPHELRNKKSHTHTSEPLKRKGDMAAGDRSRGWCEPWYHKSISPVSHFMVRGETTSAGSQRQLYYYVQCFCISLHFFLNTDLESEAKKHWLLNIFKNYEKRGEIQQRWQDLSVG